MGRKHPVTLRIEEAINLLERNGMDVTPATVKINAEKAITWADWTPEQASSEALDGRITRCLRERGYVITDADTRIRKDFWQCTPAELEAQLQIKKDSSDYDRSRIAAEEAVIVFLRAKEKDLGYAPYPGLFQADIDRIYSMHGLDAPKRFKAAA